MDTIQAAVMQEGTSEHPRPKRHLIFDLGQIMCPSSSVRVPSSSQCYITLGRRRGTDGRRGHISCSRSLLQSASILQRCDLRNALCGEAGQRCAAQYDCGEYSSGDKASTAVSSANTTLTRSKSLQTRSWRR